MIDHVSLEIELDSCDAAMIDNPRGETARILKQIITDIQVDSNGDHIRDINGNTIGSWWYDEHHE